MEYYWLLTMVSGKVHCYERAGMNEVSHYSKLAISVLMYYLPTLLLSFKIQPAQFES